MNTSRSAIIIWSLIVLAAGCCAGWIITSIQLYNAHARINELQHGVKAMKEKEVELSGDVMMLKNDVNFLSATVRAQRKRTENTVTIITH